MSPDKSELFVYVGRGPKPWWLSGVVVPRPGTHIPRDIVWELKPAFDSSSYLRLTLDLRTLKLYAAIQPR